MKISIIGYSGSGKSTLAKNLSKHYGIPVLHMDSVHFLENWKERDNPLPSKAQTSLVTFPTTIHSPLLF